MFGVSKHKQSRKWWGEFRYLQQIFLFSLAPSLVIKKVNLKLGWNVRGKKINRQFPLMELHWLLNVTIWVTTSTESNESLKPLESKESTAHLSLLSDSYPDRWCLVTISTSSLGQLWAWDTKSCVPRANGMNLLVYGSAVQELHDKHTHGTQTLHMPFNTVLLLP